MVILPLQTHLKIFTLQDVHKLLYSNDKMDLRIDEGDETGALTATYIESRSSGNGRIDIIVSFATQQWRSMTDELVEDA